MTSINFIYRFIYWTSLGILAIGLTGFIVGLIFFDLYAGMEGGSLAKLFGFIILISPFAPVGTLFGTLKESQTTGKKLRIIGLTLLSVLLLLFFIWGTIIAKAFG